MNTNKQLFNDNWEFTRQPVSGSLYEDAAGWYRKKYVHIDSGTQSVLCFDGIYMDSAVFINGRKAGAWKYGYTIFEFDISRFLQNGENEITIHVLYKCPNSRWFSGAGIYRNVWLKHVPENHIVTDGLYISTRMENGTWTLTAVTEYILDKPGVLRHTITDPDGHKTAVFQQDIKPSESGTASDRQTYLTENPYLWKFPVSTNMEQVLKMPGTESI